MYSDKQIPFYLTALHQRPQAFARLTGSRFFPSIRGLVRFWQTESGVLAAVEVSGLPDPEGPCASPVFGFHIHSGNACTGTECDPFADAGGHDNPDNCPHPYHAGDLPPLFGNHGYALSIFLTDRFSVREVVGKTVILHGSPDDFTTQPAGNAGEKMACGVIVV